MNLNELLESYQSKSLFKVAALGGNGVPDDKEEVATQQAILQSRLEEVWKFSDRILVVIFIVLIAFVIFLGILIWKYYNQTAVVVGLVTGQGGGIYFAIDRMNKLYKENITSRMLLNLLKASGSPEERTKIIDSVMTFLKEG